MNILIISGSHRHGNTERFVKIAASVLEEFDNSVEILTLLDCRFQICDGCLICESTGCCVIEDEFTKIIRPMLEWADAYVFASPIYFNNVPALMKNYMDRTNCLCEYYSHNRKKVALFLVGQLSYEENSVSTAVNYWKEYFSIMDFDFSENYIFATARNKGELEVTDLMKKQIAEWFKQL